MARLPDHLTTGPVGEQPISPELRDDYQRRRVLVGATRVFAERGYWATTVDEIVAAARIGVGGFYEQFEDKEACFLAALERAIEVTWTAAKAQEQAGWGDQVIVVLDGILGLAAREPATLKLIVTVAPNANPRAALRYDELVEALSQRLRQGRTAGSPLPACFERGILSGVAGLMRERLSASGPGDITEIRSDVAQAVLTPYLDETETGRLLGLGGDG